MMSSMDTCCNQLINNATTLEDADLSPMFNSSKEIVTCEGANIELFCNVTSSFFPQINWRKNKDLFPGDSLVLSNIQRNNHGTYWCEVSDNGSAILVRKGITLVVEFPPVCFISVPNIEIVEVNDTIIEKECILQCIVEAFPLPTVTWYKEDTELQDWFDSQFNVTLYEVDYSTTLSELRVVFVQNGTFMESHLGNYSCRAVNKHGTSSAILQLAAPCQNAPEIVSDGHAKQARGNVTGFVIGMMPPLIISVYLIIQLGYRSRFAEGGSDQDGRRPDLATR